MGHLAISQQTLSNQHPSNTLTQSAEADSRLQTKTQRSRKGVRGMPLRWYEIVSLHLAGRTHKEIAAATGYSEQGVQKVLRDERTQHIRQLLMEDTQREFDALWSTVVNNLREQLTSMEPNIQLAAQNQWLRASGKMQPKQAQITNQITAEDIVIQILNNAND